MIKQSKGESRKDYLIRVAIIHISNYARYEAAEYDDAICDGYCLITDLQDVLESEEQ